MSEEQDPIRDWKEERDKQIRKNAVEALFDGAVRAEITCEEARREWFVMARCMYVENNPEPRFPVDMEVGLHLGGCSTRECVNLLVSYETILKPSHPNAKGLLGVTLDKLEKSIFSEEE